MEYIIEFAIGIGWIHSISYKNSADEEYKQAMLNENEEVMIEIYEMVTRRGDCGTSIDIL